MIKTKTLFQLCYPLFLNSFLALAVTLVDTLIISNYSDAAAAAVSMANQVLGVFYDFAALLGVGGVILITQSLGKGDEARAREIASVTIVANAALGLLMALVLVLIGPSLLRMINTPPEILADAQLYVHVIAVAMVFHGFLMAAVACLRAFGQVMTILVLGIVANVLYLLLEYALIYGYGPIPELGVFGSALATLIVRVTGVAILAWVLVRHLRLRFRLRMAARRLAALFKRLFNLSYPSVLDNIAYGFYQLILVGFIAGLGVATVLGRSYTLTLTAFLTLIVMTVSQGNEVLVGYQVGAGNTEHAFRRAMRSSLLAAALATGMAAVLYLAAGPLIGMFTADPEIHRLGRELLFLTIFLQPVAALNAILFHSLKVTGDVYAPVIASQTIMWLVGLPLAYLAAVALGLGVVGLWYVYIVEETLKSGYMLHRWYNRRWRDAMAPASP